jgi:hypothetical protein
VLKQTVRATASIEMRRLRIAEFFSCIIFMAYLFM